jgi:hypothetical protein
MARTQGSKEQQIGPVGHAWLRERLGLSAPRPAYESYAVDGRGHGGDGGGDPALVRVTQRYDARYTGVGVGPGSPLEGTWGMSDHPKDEAARRRGRPRGRVPRWPVVVAIGLIVLALAGCGLSRETIAVTVINLCEGPDASVDVYVNDELRGTVDHRDSFAGVAPGLVRLRAVGTGEGGSTFETERTSYHINAIWTLCPGGSQSR